MDRVEQSITYHHNGFNCCQSVVAAFTDLTGLDPQKSMDLGAGFGGGAGNGELCGALVGGILVLGLLTPVELEDPVGSKKRTLALSKELQARFAKRYGGNLRCHDLLANKLETNEMSPGSVRLGLTAHCDIMIASAVELVEEILAERI